MFRILIILLTATCNFLWAARTVDMWPESSGEPLNLVTNQVFLAHTTSRGHFLYAFDWYSLFILDLSDHRHPILLSQTKLPGSPNQCVLSGNYAYVASEEAGVNIVDVSDPTLPKLVTTFDTPLRAQRVTLGGNLLYVSDENAILVLDIQTPAEPKELSRLKLTGTHVWDIAINGDYGYVVAYSAMHVLDLSNPASPVFVRSFLTNGFSGCNDVEIFDGTLFVTGSPGLRAFDLTDPSNPVEIGKSSILRANTVSIKFQDHFAITSSTSGGIFVLDITNPRSITLAGQWTVGGLQTTGLTLFDGSLVFALTGTLNSLVSCRITPSSPQIISSLSNLPFAGNFFMGRSSVLRDWYSVDIKDPLNPILLTNTVPWVREPFALSGNRAATADDQFGLRIFELDNSDHFQLLGSITNPAFRGFMTGIALAGNIAVVCDNSFNGLWVYDVSDPGSPVLKTNFIGTFTAISYDANADIFAVIQAKRPKLLDLSNPLSLHIVGEVPDINNAVSILVKNERLFVTTASNSFSVYNMADPSTPTLLDTVATRSVADRIQIQGDCAYLNEGGNGYEVFDMRNPRSLFRRGGCSLPGSLISNAQNLFFLQSNSLFILELFPRADLQMSSPVFDLDGSIKLTVQGPREINVAIDRSNNLLSWQPWQTNLLKNGVLDVIDPSKSPSHFYRAQIIE
jgi:hypothetical protein